MWGTLKYESEYLKWSLNAQFFITVKVTCLKGFRDRCAHIIHCKYLKPLNRSLCLIQHNLSTLHHYNLSTSTPPVSGLFYGLEKEMGECISHNLKQINIKLKWHGLQITKLTVLNENVRNSQHRHRQKAQCSTSLYIRRLDIKYTCWTNSSNGRLKVSDKKCPK